MGSGSVLSGNVASGQIGRYALASGIIGSGLIVSGSINSGQIGFGTPSVTTFLDGTLNWATPGAASVGSGDIGSGKIASGAVQGFFGATRHIASGTVGVYDFGSGNISQFAGPYVSGTLRSVITAEPISGIRAVAIGVSGNILIAMASVATRMPAVGVVLDNVASGIQANVYTLGTFQTASGLIDTSGYVGQILYVGRSGQAVTISGSFNSGGFLSGDIRQPLGYSLTCASGATSGLATFSVAAQLAFVEGQVLSGDIASGQVDWSHLASGSVQGLVTRFTLGSGTFTGFELGSGSIVSGRIASGQIGRFHIASGQLAGFELGSGAIVSGRIASGQIGDGHLASGQIQGLVTKFTIASGTFTGFELGSGAIVSGRIASGQIGNFHLSSGSVTSGRLGTTGTPDGSLFLRDDFTWAAAGASLTSGAVNSGKIASGAVQGFFGATRHIASGTVGVFDFGSGAVTAGTIGSGAVGSGNVGSGQIGNFHLSSGSVTSGRLGVTGAPDGTKLLRDDFSWVTPGAASVNSGDIVQEKLSSGLMIRDVATIVSGYNPLTSGMTEEAISGFRAVCISASGNLRIAMAGTAARMPAIGVVIGNTASGIQANVHQFGVFVPTSGMVELSGYGSQLLYVGRSGQIVTQSGSFNSGGLLSGDISQPVGVALQTFSGDGVPQVIQLAVAATLPFVPSLIYSGNIASGQIGDTHLASGQVQGLVTKFAIGSGTFGGFELGSGSIVSGRIGSGQVGNFHLSSGSVTSGRLGTTGTPDGSLFLRDDFSWAAAGASLTSGAVNSGKIASGAVQGFFGATRHVASGTIGVFDFGSGAVAIGAIGSGAVVSGNIASGQIGTGHLADNAVTSGDIASGQVSRFHLASGEVQGLTTSFNVASGTFGGFELGSGSIVSGRIASGQVGDGHIASGQIQGLLTKFSIGSGTFGGFELGSGAIVSGRVGSGQIGNFHLSSGSVTSGRLGVTGAPDGTKLLRDDFSWVAPGAASVNSGDIVQEKLASGLMIRDVATMVSGYNPLTSGMTEESISGVRAVCISPSGNIRIAMAGTATRMPAIGVVLDNTASGIQANVHQFGVYVPSSGMVELSGYGATLLYVGRSGQIVTQSGSFNSGGLLSGDITQPIGIALQSFSGDGVPQVVQVAVAATLPFVPSLIYSGNIGSGQIGRFHIASGQLAGFELGSGAIVSGRVASGQIGNFHLSSGSVTSGRLGVTETPDGTKFLRDDFSWRAAGALLTSGAINQDELASGLIIRDVATIVSGYNPLISGMSEESISGVRAVCVSQSGNIRIAMASVSGRMPAIGVVVDNTASGIQANVHQFGVFAAASGMFEFSGYGAQLLYVGRSGQVVTQSGSWNSGGLLSGDVIQPVGLVLQTFSGAGQPQVPMLAVAAMLPFVPSKVISGNIASGQVWSEHFGSGATTTNSITSLGLHSGVVTYTAIASEPISGLKLVCVDKAMSGLSVRIAMCGLPASGRLPAIGIVTDNTASGVRCNVITQGPVVIGSGYIGSGFIMGRRMWVGRSGDPIVLSGGYGSGGFVSGDLAQCIGVLKHVSSGGTSGMLMINIDHTLLVGLSGLFGGVALGAPYLALSYGM